MSTTETEAAAASDAAVVAVAAAVAVPLPAGLALVEIPPEKGKVTPNPAYVASRGVSKKAVIVLHEWWGVTPAVQKQAVEWFGAECVVIVLVRQNRCNSSRMLAASRLEAHNDCSAACSLLCLACAGSVPWCRGVEFARSCSSDARFEFHASSARHQSDSEICAGEGRMHKNWTVWTLHVRSHRHGSRGTPQGYQWSEHTHTLALSLD